MVDAPGSDLDLPDRWSCRVASYFVTFLFCSWDLQLRDRCWNARESDPRSAPGVLIMYNLISWLEFAVDPKSQEVHL